MYNVVFLDIDGVLNSNFWCENNQREISNGILIDKDKVKLLSTLVKTTSAKIILHSGWRFWFDSNLKSLRIEAEKLVDIFQREGLSIEGVTQDLTTEEIRLTKKFSLVKADEILLWISEHKDVQNWIVIDDLDLHNSEIEQHQIKTDNTIGLTVEDLENAKKMLLRK